MDRGAFRGGGALRGILLGDAAVGKTSILNALRGVAVGGDSFQNNTYSLKTTAKDGTPVTLQIVDTSGWEVDGLEPLSRLATSNDVFLVCFSLISPTSIENVIQKWVPEIQRIVGEHHGSKHAPILLIGTKPDLREDPEILERLAQRRWAPITYEQGLALKRQINAINYVEVCSLAPQDVFAALGELANFSVGLTTSDDKSSKKQKKTKKQPREKKGKKGCELI